MHASTTTALTDCHMYSELLMCAMCYSIQINRGFVCLFLGVLWVWFKNGNLKSSFCLCSRGQMQCLFVFTLIPHKFWIDFNLFLSKGNSTWRRRDEAHGKCVFMCVNLWWKILVIFFKINICLPVNVVVKRWEYEVAKEMTKNYRFLHHSTISRNVFWNLKWQKQLFVLVLRPNPGYKGKAAVPLCTTHWWGTASSSSWSTPWTPSVMNVKDICITLEKKSISHAYIS